MCEKSKILLIIEGTYPWYRGGVSEWVFQYLQHLDEFNFHILQVATDEFQGLDPEEALYPLTENIKSFTRISPPHDLYEWDKIKFNWLDEVPKSFGSLSFDLVHIANTGFAGWLGVQISKQFEVPLILTEHAIYWKEVEKGAVALECGYQIPDTKSLKTEMVEIFKSIAEEVYSNTDEIISVSRVNIKEQQKLGAQFPKYIPNGVSKDLISKAKVRSEIPTIGWIGRCAEMKNPKKFFEVVDAFVELNFEAEFIIMLSDANEPELELKIRSLSKKYPKVEVIWNKDAKKYLSRLDFLCITSHNESQPLVMFEALSNKAIPFGWQVGDLTNEFGFVKDQESDIRELVSGVCSLWSDQNEFENFVEEKFNYLNEYHIWQKIFPKYKDLFEELTQNKQVA